MTIKMEFNFERYPDKNKGKSFLKSFMNYLGNKSSKNISIFLYKFDEDYFNSLEDKNKIIYRDNINNKFYTIVNELDDKKIGVCGVMITIGRHNYFQIIIEPEYRGKNIVRQVSDLVIEDLNIRTLDATIDKNNIASIKAHTKAGFELIRDNERKLLILNGKLTRDQLRLRKYRSHD